MCTSLREECASLAGRKALGLACLLVRQRTKKIKRKRKKESDNVAHYTGCKLRRCLMKFFSVACFKCRLHHEIPCVLFFEYHRSRNTVIFAMIIFLWCEYCDNVENSIAVRGQRNDELSRCLSLRHGAYKIQSLYFRVRRTDRTASS